MKHSNIAESIEYRIANIEELDGLKKLLWDHGPNPWNYLTPEGVDAEFFLVTQGKAQAVIAVDGVDIVGLAVLIEGGCSPVYLQEYCKLDEIDFVGDVVVSSQYAGRGIATRLLTRCIELARAKGKLAVFIERHEENLASAGMMRKAGFDVVDCFHDPEKRTTGSRNSVILACQLS